MSFDCMELPLTHLGNFHHLGVACCDIALMRDKICCLLPIVEKTEIIEDPVQSTKLCLLTDSSGLRYELVSGKVVENFLQLGQAFYHICYEVADIDKTASYLKSYGCKTVLQPTKAVLFANRRVSFFYTPFGLLELLEQGK